MAEAPSRRLLRGRKSRDNGPEMALDWARAGEDEEGGGVKLVG